ncbi:hypothetical protein ACH5RR_019962 [Cinchona calisaya]|uniref:Glycine zipper 2TM domain-containing protein n=1 Tax=Cinchona calisaya TaxID=153742 RepID=A0ABD2ZE70_9GENT
MKIQLLSLAAIVILSFSAEKCRQLVGEEYFSRTGKERFNFLNCFDMSYGTLACIVKELVKLYLYYIRAVHVHKVRVSATQKALAENLSRGQSFEEAIMLARQVGDASARAASLQAKHIMGPTISSGWDLFETLYVGGTLAEGMVRSVGTFVGAYAGGMIGEGNLGWSGFLVGSQMGSWVGGRIGLMVYDVGNGVQYLLRFINQGGSKYDLFL